MIQAGDGSRAFEALYRGLYPLVVRTVYLVILDRDVAQEITHEAFLRLWEHRPRLGQDANNRAWLLRVAVNLAIDHRRRLFTTWRHQSALPPTEDPAATALARLERDEIVLQSSNFLICQAAFKKALFVWPNEHLQMRQGARIIAKSKEDPGSSSAAAR